MRSHCPRDRQTPSGLKSGSFLAIAGGSIAAASHFWLKQRAEILLKEEPKTYRWLELPDNRGGMGLIRYSTKVTEILKRDRVSDYIVTDISSKISYSKVYQDSGRP